MKVNGQEVASSTEWQKPIRIDLAPYLKKGNNHIEVKGEMFGGSAGFIAQISLVDDDSTTTLITDNTWQARAPGGTWGPARELHPHAKGPWGPILNGPIYDVSEQAQPIRAALVKNDFLMRSLGRPHRDQVVTTRPGELTTLQAIDLANGDALAAYMNQGAKRLVSEGKSSGDLIDWLYHFALSREATEGERTVLLGAAGDGSDPVAVEDLLWLVCMQPEFQIIR